MSRGQLLPAWIANILLTMTFMAFLLSYGNVVAYQFRAQSAADSVAAALVNIQAQQFNEMTETLYAADVEEYRLRHHLEALRITANFSGGCDANNTNWPEPLISMIPQPTSAGAANFGQCPGVWATLVDAYHRSLMRYDADAQILSRITATMNYANLQNDIVAFNDDVVNAACSAAGAGSAAPTAILPIDCGKKDALFHYNVLKVQQRTAGLKDATMDAMTNELPSYSATGTSKAWMDTFAPVAVDVSVCATVPPLFSMSWPLHLTPTIIVARAAATDGIVEEDWLQPGNTVNPATGAAATKFQPYELYAPIWDTTMNTISSGKGFGWYNVDFAGNASQTTYAPNTGNAPYGSVIKANIVNQEFSARAGWWGAVPIAPFATTFGASASTDAEAAAQTGCAGS
jgi:hypothetical protein